MVEAEGEHELDEGIQMLSSTLDRLEEEEDNKEALLEWVTGVCDPEFGMVEGLVANFIDSIEDKEYSKKILKILV
jgi:hypothetical protein